MADGNGEPTAGAFMVRGRRPVTVALVVAFLLATLVFMERSGGAAITSVSTSTQTQLLTPVVPTPDPPVAPTTADEAFVLAKKTADEAVATSRQALISGELQAVVCEILLSARATVITTINTLIAEFPTVAAELALIRDAAVEIIDTLLAQLGCAMPSSG